MTWQKSYVYAGSRLLSTITNTSGNEVTEYHHPDRLGTRLISNPTTATQNEQLTLPFGTLISAETSATSNQRFTSYDRSEIAGGLDYAVNRNYNSGQSRFTQVDPIGMASASIGDPQSLNMYAYVQNNPIDFTDPSGLCIVNLNGETGSSSLSGCLVNVGGRRDMGGGSGGYSDTPFPEDEPGEPGEGGDDETGFECTPPDPSANDLWAAEAVAHYMGGSGEPIRLPLAAVEANPPSPFDFNGVQAAYNKGEGTYTFEDAHSPPIQVGNLLSSGGLQGQVLGRITFTLSGTLKVDKDLNYMFHGTIGILPDRFDFTDDDKGKQNRGLGYDQSASIGNQIPGKAFLIYIHGKWDVLYRNRRDGSISRFCERQRR